jgi:hypothetical protein
MDNIDEASEDSTENEFGQNQFDLFNFLPNFENKTIDKL